MLKLSMTKKNRVISYRPEVVFCSVAISILVLLVSLAWEFLKSLREALIASNRKTKNET